MKKQFIIPFLTILVAACGGTADKKEKLEELKKQLAATREQIEQLEAELATGDSLPSLKTKMVSVSVMRPQPFRHYIEVQARVEGDEDVMVSAQYMGSITSVNVKAGDRVGKGQVMAAIDDRAIRQSLESLKTQLELATTVYARQKNLWDQKIGSEIQYLNAKTQKESLEKQVASLQDQWDLTRIKSPINGTVDEVRIKAGQTVAPGMPSIRVVNLADLKVTAEVAESYINTVNRNNPVRIYFPDSKTELEAKVDYAGRAINALNRTFNVEVRLNNKQGTFYPNQVAILKIADYSSQKAFTVPVGAVMKASEGEYVFIAESQDGHLKAVRRMVRPGMTYNGITEIVEGLNAEEKVITFGYQNLVDGDPVSF